jgi:type III pantothenate kinase
VQVREPERVGVDRLAAAFAAGLLKPADQPAVVLDVGTAITIDAIDRDGAFLGGSILPGIELAARALAHGTSQLPQLTGAPINPPGSVIGRDTEQAIASGLLWGCVGAISHIVERMRSELPTEPAIFMTGGGAAAILPWLTFQADAQPDLVMVGTALAAAIRR